MTPTDSIGLDPQTVNADVARALQEDIGSGDLTAGLIPAQNTIQAELISREDAVLCGSAWFNASFSQLDSDIQVDWHYQDGDEIRAQDRLASLSGPARGILTGERTAMNFVQTLSGTATVTRSFALKITDLACRLLDTRKTVPGLRLAQKYAVRCGGGHNHRIGLYDGVLIKENHIRSAGSIQTALAAAGQAAPPGLLLEIEVERLDELQAALAAGARRILLDNFSAEQLRQAVAQTQGRAQLEASGNITLANIHTMAETGVDFVSVGGLTKNIVAIDLSLQFDSIP